MSFAIFYINAPYMKNITLTYLCKNKWNMSQFTGFSEDDLERIKSGETADESKNSTYWAWNILFLSISITERLFRILNSSARD